VQATSRLTRADVCMLTQQVEIGRRHAGPRRLFFPNITSGAGFQHQSLSRATIFSLPVC
jgi:hypothetical protein